MHQTPVALTGCFRDNALLILFIFPSFWPPQGA